MAITYGYFNSVDGDRVYNADQMSEYFDGIVSNGVYENVGGALQVKAIQNGGMSVTVEAGRAIVNSKWIKNDAVLTVDITAAHATLNRYTAVIIKLDNRPVARNITITTKDGTPASSPTKPSMTNTGTIVELCLAYIYVAAGATSIVQANITDTRGTSVCGWVTGVIQQVDTSTLFLQYQDAFQRYYAEMSAEFTEWFQTLTTNLSVNTFVKKFTKRVVNNTGSTTNITLDMTGYTYSNDDVIMVFINGLYGSPTIDYTLTVNNGVATVTPTATTYGTETNIVVLKSLIGFNSLIGSDGSNIVDNDNSEVLV